MPDERDELRGAIEALAALKAEHGPILRQIAGDTGMRPETRQLLIEHLYEEEEEHVQAMLGLRAAPPLAGEAAAAPAGGSRLSVGDLRPAEPPRTQLGSLRPPQPPYGSGAGLPTGCTVGSLRS